MIILSRVSLAVKDELNDSRADVGIEEIRLVEVESGRRDEMRLSSWEATFTHKYSLSRE